MIGTLTWNLGTCRNLYLEPLYLEPPNLLTWNPYLEPRNLLEPLLGTLTRNLGTCRNLYLEPLLGTSEPAGPRNLPEPLLGTLTWNVGTCRNLYLEPSLGTSEPARTWRDDCPRVPQGLVWLGPQSFQLLGKNIVFIKAKNKIVFIPKTKKQTVFCLKCISKSLLKAFLGKPFLPGLPGCPLIEVGSGLLLAG